MNEGPRSAGDAVPRVVDHLAAHEDRLVETTLDLVRFESPNPPGHTAGLVDYLQTLLEEAGVETEPFAVDPAKPNLLATIPGERDETLLFLGHLDTVPFDPDEWTRDPLGERVTVAGSDGAEDRIYGRGANDMKGAVAAMVEVFRTVAETGTTPPVTLELALVSDEETAGPAGLAALLEADVIAADACVIGETTCEEGCHSVTVADRGSIWITLEAEGRAAHGSRPMLGENAIDALWAAVDHLRTSLGERELPIDPAVEPIVEESVAYYAPRLGEAAARDLFEYPTVNLGEFEGGETVNAVPEAARARLDVRLSPGVQTPDVLADVRACVDDHENVQISDVSWSIGTYVPRDHPIAEATATLASEVTGGHVYRRSATGGGDAKKLRNAGIVTIEFALGTDTAHAIDEYTTVAALRGTATVYARLPYAYADRLD